MRTAPRRVLALNRIYSSKGGIARYVLDRIEAGVRVRDLAAELGEALGEPISQAAVYGWIARFQAERNKEVETDAALQG